MLEVQRKGTKEAREMILKVNTRRINPIALLNPPAGVRGVNPVPEGLFLV